MGYTNTDKMWRIWDFERKLFVNSYNLIFSETQFPKPSDFDELPADPYDCSTPSPSSEPSEPPEPQPIFDEIILQPEVVPLPTLHTFKTYGDFQLDKEPPSFIDAI